MDLYLAWDPIIKVILAMVLGGLMGLERELAKKPAGLRTHMLVAGASSFLVVLGNIMIQNYSGVPAFQGSVQADPIRIMDAIITGISFLGAGTIIFNKNDTVEGLTTAASILFAAALGISVALHAYLLAVAMTVLAVLILSGLGYIEKFIPRLRKRIYSDLDNGQEN